MQLRKARVAHGDLQHGNILVVHDDFKLIDYDDMFVPALAGFESNVTGDRNYQHPDRTKSYFDETIDAFSDWVIYLSLVALSIDSTLWSKTQAGEENGHLIFSQRDFVDPFSSDVLGILRSSHDLRLQGISSLITSLACSDIRAIPALDPKVLDSYGTGTPSSPVSVSTAGMPSWLQDYLQIIPETVPGTTDSSSPANMWIFDHLGPQTDADLHSFHQEIAYDRLFVLRTFIGIVASETLSWAFSLVLPLLVALMVLLPILSIASMAVVLAFRYRRMPSVHAARAVRSEEREQYDAVTEAEQTLQKIQREHSAIDKQESNETATLVMQRDNLVAEKQRTINEVRLDEQKRIHQITQRRNSLGNRESQERQGALTPLRSQHFNSLMASRMLRPGDVSGIGATTIATLNAYGFRTAGDITQRVEVVPGIGPTKRISLQLWRQRCEANFQSQLPTQLPPKDEDAIRLKYTTEKSSLLDEERKIKAASITKIADLERRYSQRIQQTEIKQKELAALHVVNKQDRGSRIKPYQKALADAQWKLGQSRHRARPFATINARRYIRAVFIP